MNHLKFLRPVFATHALWQASFHCGCIAWFARWLQERTAKPRRRTRMSVINIEPGTFGLLRICCPNTEFTAVEIRPGSAAFSTSEPTPKAPS